MSTLVTDIFTAVNTVASTSLGAEFRLMRRIFNPEENDFRTAKNSYAVNHGAASPTDGVTKVYTLDHSFEVMLMSTFVERNDDADVQVVINTLYDKGHDLLKQMFLTKLGLPAIVLIVDNPSLSDYEVLENEAVLIRVGFNVKYRNAIA